MAKVGKLVSIKVIIHLKRIKTLTYLKRLPVDYLAVDWKAYRSLLSTIGAMIR